MASPAGPSNPIGENTTSLPAPTTTGKLPAENEDTQQGPPTPVGENTNAAGGGI